jgi:predicted protein tyrosine phosphatase
LFEVDDRCAEVGYGGDEMKKKIKVLAVCAKGLNRSKYLAQYLSGKGYSTKHGGVEGYIGWDGKDIANYLTPEVVDWADVIIIVRKRVSQIFKKKFKTKGKKIIVFDITDSKRLISEQYPDAKNWTRDEMNKKITYPRLREAIKPFLPLKI